ncbi:alpha/beta fold hydrolase [Streptomyces sp. NPDC048419]|uniref:alpha/beta fold hydrolase n=1 Tax=Streptomyces sp. NPDC048419 TaxID=3365547 RepID=UPI00371A57A1
MTSSTASVTTAVDRPLPHAEGAKHSRPEVRGIRLHVAEYGAGAPVLLLHGFPQHWFAWHRVAGLSGAGRRLICPDLRGFGWSEQTQRGYDIDGLCDDMLALLDVLGLDRVGLVGHDWGAHVGFRLCLRAPERFTGHLALNMAHPWTRQRAVLPNLWRQWYTAFIEYPIVQGQRSGCVTELHSLLNHHGADLAVDGDFGPLTDSAVRDFHAEKGLSVDGRVGPNTKAALYGAVTPPSSPPPGGGHGKILDVAEAEVGTVEGSARANSYGSAVGLSLSTSDYAWCATFVSWVARETGATSYRNSYVSGWVKQARAGNYHLSVTTSPQPGDRDLRLGRRKRLHRAATNTQASCGRVRIVLHHRRGQHG